MSRLDSIFEDSILIAKKLTGQLTEQENDLFNQWLQKESNRRFFKRIQDNQNFLIRNEQYESVNIKRGWNEFSVALNFHKKKTRLYSLLKYAAVILLPIIIGISVHYYVNHQIEVKNRNIQLTSIKPGTRNAILVLDNGQKIDLDKQNMTELKESDGTIINKINDELSYTGNGSVRSKKRLQNIIVIPRGGEYSLVLSDSTKVFLNSMSKLAFPVIFSGGKREISLEGEAYFEVHKDKQHPFIVNVNGMQIKVLGTAFNVKAYTDEQNVYTTLVEGQVIINTEKQSGKECLLFPNQQAVFDKLNEGLNIRKVDASQYMQWTIGKYVFTDQTLDEIMRSLSRWYDFVYSYSDESIKNLRFEGGLDKYRSIDPIIDIIERTGKVKVMVKGKEIIFMK